ncbi:MAG: hypothetical protein MUC74_10950 [Ideonella sp.]|nr:hypothetical protein [Ideonella sp.]
MRIRTLSRGPACVMRSISDENKVASTQSANATWNSRVADSVEHLAQAAQVAADRRLRPPGDHRHLGDAALLQQQGQHPEVMQVELADTFGEGPGNHGWRA